jgi:hypothetical protein
MTDTANLATQTPPHRATVENVDPGYLVLPNAGPTAPTVYDVWVSLQMGPNGLAAAVGNSATPTTWYLGGVSWSFYTAQSEYGLFINFHITTQRISDLSVVPNYPTFWFSSLYSTTAQQWSCLPCGTTQLQYHFQANTPPGGTVLDRSYDPIVIVTPITGDPCE